MEAQPGDKMELILDAELKSGPGSTGPEEYSVLVTVKGPSETPKKSPRASPGVGADAEGRGVDLVAVLDISKNMKEEGRLEDMKDAMYLVIRKLGQGDRLSIVSFDHRMERVMPLTELTKANQEIARSMVENLQVGGDAKGNGMDNESKAKAEATEILAERTEKEEKDRVGRVIFLSKGDADADTKQTKKARPETAADSFLLGAGDSLSALTQSDGGGGSSVAFAFAKQSVDKMASSIGGLKSADTSKTVQIDLQALTGVDISGIESGSNGLSLSGKAQKLITVFIPGLGAGEHKSFTVSLKVHKPTTTDFLCATGWCKGRNDEDYAKFDYKLIDVGKRLPPPPPCWQARLANLLVPSPTPEKGPKTPPHDPEEIEEKIVITGPDNPALGKKKPEVGKTDHHPPRWGTWLLSMIQINFKKIKWSNTYSWALALLLLGVGVAMLINLITDDPVPPPPPPPPPPMPDLDISQHPGWPKMEESIALITLKKIDEARITSSLRGASIEEISSAMNRYIYQALVHDTGLHVSLLEEAVQTLQAETEELRVNVEKLANDKKQKEEKKEAVERANATIADLQRQLAGVLEKKAT